ncbi:MAG: S26 family signal peptidase, partial [Flavobacteriales bacterium]
MLVGDYLFVSKVSYGPKSPQTPISMPFVHNNMPASMTPSYVDWFSMPYFRLPGLGDVERFDPVVFNFPPGDTIIIDPVLSTFDFYQKRRLMGIEMAKGVDNFIKDESLYLKAADKELKQRFGLRQRPLDKREHYIKRCIGLPGDKLAIVDGEVFINDAAIETPSEVQFNYRYTLKKTGFQSKMEEKLGLTKLDIAATKGREGIAAFTLGEIEELIAMDITDTLYRLPHVNQQGTLDIFPNSALAPYNSWDIDNFGPVVLPAKGLNIPLSSQNIEMYERAITHFEGHDLRIEGDKIFIDGVETDSFTFDLNYYWMMGDNRHNSLDSRFWGFVPETHVVGKAVFTWFSKANEHDQGPGKGGIRWDRMFRSVK